jgi:hypothetical protein
MSQMIRRTVVAASLPLALLLVAPAPSHAAPARKPAPAHSLSPLDQAWVWLERLLGVGKTPTVQRKTTVMTTPLPLPPPPEQGPMIDPDGAK